MKAIYLDCFAGISGNMLLGAFSRTYAAISEEIRVAITLFLLSAKSRRKIARVCSFVFPSA